MKQCNKCNEVKPYEEFHKRTYKGVQGYQYSCKICQNKYNNKYRKEIRPEYWNATDGYFSHRENWEYIADYRRANEDIKVYLMKVKDAFYIGMTKTKLNVRISTHRADYKNKASHDIPGLYKMWDTMSEEEINESLASTIVLETKPGPRYQGYKLEKKWIKFYKERGYKLLNTIHNI
mgnify:FL=1|tara:strand:+ start:67 stop:597 length:531 start_codon:yes stop_codon:yes gene_type:complete